MSMTMADAEDFRETDHRQNLLDALAAYQQALAANCWDSTKAEAIAISAHHEAIRNVRSVGTQPRREG